MFFVRKAEKTRNLRQNLAEFSFFAPERWLGVLFPEKKLFLHGHPTASRNVFPVKKL